MPQCQVFIDDKKVKTKLLPNNTLMAFVPKEDYAKFGKMTVEVKVKDSHQIVVSDSNQLSIEVK